MDERKVVIRSSVIALLLFIAIALVEVVLAIVVFVVFAIIGIAIWLWQKATGRNIPS